MPATRPRTRQGVIADPEARHQLQRTGQDIAPSRLCLAFAHAAEVADLIGSVAVALGRQCARELRVGSGAVCAFGMLTPRWSADKLLAHAR